MPSGGAFSGRLFVCWLVKFIIMLRPIYNVDSGKIIGYFDYKYRTSFEITFLQSTQWKSVLLTRNGLYVSRYFNTDLKSYASQMD